MRRAALLLPLVLVACSRGGDPQPQATTAPPAVTTTTPAATPSTTPPAASRTTPAPASSATPRITVENGPVHFRTPTGNIGCYLDDEVVCDIAEHTWRLPPEPRDCEFDWVAGATISGTFDAAIGRCASDTTLGATRVLAYDTGVRTDQFQCVSRRDGVTCGAIGGDGFFLSRTSARVIPFR